ncbi:MAG: hypothetical protein BWY13_00057 [Euryarchaeota archaeon ADurb.Bin190]|nr:MAG: hypothetical protein BWY13_00057 [Euryarchaeota archaeon ADurb.Bin190]
MSIVLNRREKTLTRRYENTYTGFNIIIKIRSLGSIERSIYDYIYRAVDLLQACIHRDAIH